MFYVDRELKQLNIQAQDEASGSIEDFYFDDQSWRVRYLVAATGFPLFGHNGLISVERFGKPDPENAKFPVDLSAKEVKNAVSPEGNPPVSEQSHSAVGDHAAIWPPYLMIGEGGYSPALAQMQVRDYRGNAAYSDSLRAEMEQDPDPHLRSMNEVRSYAIAAKDGDIGSVTDFLIDPENWQIRYVAVDTGSWLPGKQVVIAIDWCETIDWENQHIGVNVTKKAVEESPDIASLSGLDRTVEEQLYGRYGAVGYWPV